MERIIDLRGTLAVSVLVINEMSNMAKLMHMLENRPRVSCRLCCMKFMREKFMQDARSIYDKPCVKFLPTVAKYYHLELDAKEKYHL